MRFTVKLKNRLKSILSYNSFTFDDNSNVDRNSYIKASIISGSINIGSRCEIVGSEITGVVTIGRNCILNRVTLSGKINIGSNTSIWGPNSDIYAHDFKVEIGNYCSVARNVSIQEFNHHSDRLSTYFMFKNVFKEGVGKDITSKGAIRVGNDVWIGAHSVILSGTEIGNGAIIAANSVVTGRIPPFAIVGGSPAKLIRYRFDSELIQKIENLGWWYWSEEKLLRNRHLFADALTKDTIAQVIS